MCVSWAELGPAAQDGPHLPLLASGARGANFMQAACGSWSPSHTFLVSFSLCWRRCKQVQLPRPFRLVFLFYEVLDFTMLRELSSSLCESASDAEISPQTLKEGSATRAQ